MTLPSCEIDRDAPVTLVERAAAVLAAFSPIVAMFLIGLACSGCVSEYTGSSTVVGEQMILPEITDSSDNIAVRIFEDIKGARVWTAKDSKVTIRYVNAYTNSYFGCVTTRDNMNLVVDIEPLYVGDVETNAVPASCGEALKAESVTTSP